MDTPTIRELFIEELAQVTGGAGPDPLEKVRELLPTETTHACCEEGQCCDYWS